MTFQSIEPFLPEVEDAGRRVAHLRHVLELVGQLSGRMLPVDEQAWLSDVNRIAGAYADALPIAQRRFDALAAETASWAAVGVEALLEAGSAPAAAAGLAAELDRAIGELRAAVTV